MDDFELDPRLRNDSVVLGKLNISLLLLMNNSLVPWFILVPQTIETEIVDLSQSMQINLLEEIKLLSNFIKRNFTISKLNIAAIGNIVKQLHVHIVGRDVSDYCWPNVVWGVKQQKSYTTKQINEIISSLCEQLGDRFICDPTSKKSGIIK